MTSTSRRIYHLMSAPQWNIEGRGDGAVACEHFERNGFVHCCTREQIVEIASWWLAAEAPLVAIELAADALDGMRFERAAGKSREYPHVYGALPRTAVLGAHALPQREARSFALPDAIADPPPAFEVVGRHRGRPVSARWCDGQLIEGDADLLARATELVEKRATVDQFPDVRATASLATPYEAFSVLAAAMDEIGSYRGDGFLL